MLEAEKSTAMVAMKGEVTEWLKVLVSKTSVPGFRYRGFESHPLRQVFLVRPGLIFSHLSGKIGTQVGGVRWREARLHFCLIRFR